MSRPKNDQANKREIKDPTAFACHLVYGDGACSGNPGPGGYGAIVRTQGGAVIELGDHENPTTNNRMEMMAVLRALEELEHIPGLIEVRTDSTYLVKGITSWTQNWARNHWKTKDGGEVANVDLWQALIAVVEGRVDHYGRGAASKIEWVIIPGHSGIPGNERADEIAVAYSKDLPVRLFSGPYSEYNTDLDNVAVDEQSIQKKSKSKPPKNVGAYYISLVNGVVSRHKTWAECELAVKGKSGVKFKKVADEADEKKVLASWGK